MNEPQYAAGEKVPIHISRQESNFDRACEAAYKYALMRFHADDDGYLNNVKDSERSTDSVVVEFVSYRHTGGMGGQSFQYEFVAWVERYVDEDDEE